MSSQISRRAILGTALGVLVLSACGVNSKTDRTGVVLLPYVENKQQLLALLRTMNRSEAKTVADHQQLHLDVLVSYVKRAPSASRASNTDPAQLLSVLVTQSQELALTASDAELRRILLLMGASDTVHREMLGDQG